MEIKKIAVEKMFPAKYNPRKDLKPTDKKYKHIKNSIESFGYIDPIIWNKRNGNIIGGHQRFKILQELGYTEIDVVVVDFDEETEKAANVAVNKAQGDWDKEKLDEFLREMKFTTKFDLSKFGFKMDKFKKEISEDDYTLKIPSKAITKPGDIWQLGRHKLLCGDGTNPEDVDKLMDGELADLILTDPPYNVNYGEKASMLNDYQKGHRNTDSIENDNMSDSQFYEFIKSLMDSYYRVTKPGGVVYVFHSESERINFTRALKESGYYFSENLVWVKNALVLTRQDYHYQHEPILYGWKLGAAHYFLDDRTQTTVLKEDTEIEKMKVTELREFARTLLKMTPTSVIEENKPTRNDLHPTMKPIRLCGRLITNSTKGGDLTIDFCGGSGSTLIACEETGRRANIIEIEPKYCDVIVDRWEQLTGQKAELIKVKKTKKEVK